MTLWVQGLGTQRGPVLHGGDRRAENGQPRWEADGMADILAEVGTQDWMNSQMAGLCVSILGP